MAGKKLHLDDLRVDSFDVLPAMPAKRGTVQGHISGVCTFFGYTCDTCHGGQFTCGDSCQGTCGITCYLSKCDQFCPATGPIVV